MKKTITKSQIIIIILSILFITKNSSAISTEKVLTTDHFKINYNQNNSSLAVTVALKSESCNDSITTFLELESPSRINIFISENSGQKIYRKVNDLYVESNGNFDLSEKALYQNIFMVYLHNIFQNRKGFKITGESFVSAIIQYPGLERGMIETQINDLVNYSQISSIDLTGIGKYSNDEQTIIYIALTDFIISSYGKNIFIQSLKDTAYYDNYFLSLSKITGIPIMTISDNFNTFLCKYKHQQSEESENNKKLFHDIDEFSDISYSISVNNSVAVLQKNINIFRLLLKSGENFNSISLEQSECESFYSDVMFFDNNRIALIEILKSGSTIHIFDIKNNKFSDKKFLPSLFISAIAPADDSNNSSEKHYNMIFSALCGSSSDIYTFNIETGDFNVLTENGYNYFPVSLKDKIYFVSNTDKGSIIESDFKSGKIKTLFSTERKIFHLAVADENTVVFSTKINGLENIFSFDLTSGKLCQVTSDSHSNLSPRITGKKIYFLSFYRSKYRLFFDIYNPAEF